MSDITFITSTEKTLRYFLDRVPPGWTAHFSDDLSEATFVNLVAIREHLILNDAASYPVDPDPDPGEIALRALPGFPLHLGPVRYFDGEYTK